MTKQVQQTDVDALVAAIHSAVTSAAQNWFTALSDVPVTPPPPPSHPEVLTLTTGVGSIRASWTTDPARTVVSVAAGRDGADTSGYPAYTNPAATSPITFDKLNATVYTITVVIYYTDGTAQRLTGTATPATAPPPPASPGVPKIGKSGFFVNTIRFSSNPTQLSDLQTRGAGRGMPYDGAMWFPDRATTWAKLGEDMTGGWGQSDGTLANCWPGALALLKAGHLVVTKMPIAPESEGDQMNQRGAANTYRAHQMAVAANIAANGGNVSSHVIEFGWEPNGDWYVWGVNRPGGKAAYKLAVANAIQNFKDGGLTNVRFFLCLNIGSVNPITWADGYTVGKHDGVSIDEYDMWPPAFTQADWDTHQNQALSMEGAARYALSVNGQWGLSEGGNCNPFIAGQYGGDNPKYWDFRVGSLRKYKTGCAYDVTYDQPGDIGHDFAQNPISYARVKQLYVPGA